jgi:3-oxoacyl-[acyl-carrier protein] reductase
VPLQGRGTLRVPVIGREASRPYSWQHRKTCWKGLSVEIKGCVAVVTGGTGALGRLICRALAQNGANVALGYQSSATIAKETVEDLQKEGIRAIAIQADVSIQGDVNRLVETTLQEFGRIDILINDAAYNTWVAFPDLEALTPEIWQKILQTNTTGPYMLMRAIGPIMKKQGRGRIVNIGSIAGFQPAGSSIAYAVSKAALTHLTRCMAVALAPEVLVNCVAPGFLEGTRMSSNLAPPYVEKAKKAALIGKAAEKEDVVEQILTFLRTASTTGQTVIIDGGRVFH